MDWKIRRGDSELGPMGTEELRSWIKEGRVGASDYAFHPLFERWMYLREVEELRDLFAAKIPAASATVVHSPAPQPRYDPPAPVHVPREGCFLQTLNMGCMVIAAIGILILLMTMCPSK